MNRERSQREKRVEKEADRVIRKENKKERDTSVEDGIDPDLIGIFPGPQPVQED